MTDIQIKKTCTTKTNCEQCHNYCLRSVATLYFEKNPDGAFKIPRYKLNWCLSTILIT